MASKPQPPGKTVNIRPPQTAPPAPSPESQPPNSKLQTASSESQPRTADPRQNRKVQPSPNCAPAPKPQLPESRPSPKPQAPAPDHKPQPQIANGKPQAPSPKPQISDRHGASSPTRKIPTSDLQLATSQPQAIDRKIPIPNHSSPTVYPTAPLPRPPAREVFHNAPSYISCRIPFLSTSGCMLQKFFTCYPHSTIL